MIVRAEAHTLPEVNNWGWVRMADLSRIMGLTPSRILVAYGPLSKDYGEYQSLAFTDGKILVNASIDDAILAAKKYEAAGHPNDALAIFVPAGWADDVLSAFNNGFLCTVCTSEYLTREELNTMPSDVLAITHRTGSPDDYWVIRGQTK